ncbi:MAG: DUF1688 family protein [Acidobacteriota bacterium]
MSDLDVLLDPATIRERTRRVLERAQAGGTAFSVHPEKLPACADLVLEITRRNYPDGQVPYHGRYEHFRAGGIDRIQHLERALGYLTPEQRRRSLVDLVVVSVLLDAGAGDGWTYFESDYGGGTFARSEGLAVASFNLFIRGAFSHDARHPYQVSAAGLERLTRDALARGFQVTAENPLEGLDGRFRLLGQLGRTMRAWPRIGGDHSRPGHLVDTLIASASSKRVEAPDLLRSLLVNLSGMWTPRVTLDGIGFGDVWPYFGAEPGDWVPFHKLSQWLAYSLIEPIESAGVTVVAVDALTGLPEYRNGGLFLDTGVLELRNPADAQRTFDVGDPLIIEWRALTVQLLDHVGELVRRALGKTPDEMPLARVLQGGTWAAGREVANRLRPGGAPPLRIVSDGTVF